MLKNCSKNAPNNFELNGGQMDRHTCIALWASVRVNNFEKNSYKNYFFKVTTKLRYQVLHN